MEWWRLVPAFGVFLLIEFIDSQVTSINIPWWLSLFMALFLSFTDIIVILVIDWLTDGN